MSAHFRCIDVARCVPRAISERHFIPFREKERRRGLLHKARTCRSRKKNSRRDDARPFLRARIDDDEKVRRQKRTMVTRFSTMALLSRRLRRVVDGSDVDRVQMGGLHPPKKEIKAFRVLKKAKTKTGEKKAGGKKTRVFWETIQIPLSQNPSLF